MSSNLTHTSTPTGEASPEVQRRVFICYRRNDGDWCAEWLHRNLDNLKYSDHQGIASQLQLYYDKTAPGVADWMQLHFPSLQTAHALLLVCTPGLAKDLSKRNRPDWVYAELRWWCKHRRTPPIVIDTTGEGDRWLPELITKKWPNLNRIDLTKKDVDAATSPDDRIVARARERIVETIKESDRSRVFEDLERFRVMNRRLVSALAGALVLLLAAGTAGVLAVRYNSEAKDALQMAQSRQLAAESEVTRTQRDSFVVSSLLAVEALRRAHTLEADQAARNALKLLPSWRIALKHKAGTGGVRVAASLGATRVATVSSVDNGSEDAAATEVVIWDAPGGNRVATVVTKTPVTAVSMSPNGSRVAVAHKDAVVDVWDGNTGAHLFDIPGTNDVKVMTFDRDGQRLAVGGFSSKVTVVDVASGKSTAHLFADAPVLAIEFSPSKQFLALGMAPTPELAKGNFYYLYQGRHEPSTLGPIKTAKIFDLASQRQIHELTHEGAVFALCYSKDGRYLATASWDGGARIWSTDSGAISAQYKFPETVPVTSIAFTPDDGSSFVAMAGANDEVVVWNWRENAQVAKLQDEGAHEVAFSSDGLRLGTNSGRTTRVWDYIRRTELVRIEHGSDWLDGPVLFGTDGKWLVSGGRNGSAWIWSASSGGENMSVRHDGRIEAVAFAPNGQHILTGGFDGYTRLWDATTGEELFKFLEPLRIADVAFDATGRLFASGGGMKGDVGSVHVWETKGQRVVWQKELNTRVWSIALSPDGKRVAVGDATGTAHVWDLETGEELSRVTHGEDAAIHAIAISPQGDLVASGGLDGTVRVWNASDGKELQRFVHHKSVLAIAFSGDGRLLASGDMDGNARVWQIGSGEQLLDLKHGNQVGDVKFSPDGKSLATAGRDGLARTWDVGTGNPLMALALGSQVNAVSFSPDGRSLVAASSNGQARVFALRREDLLDRICSRVSRNLSVEEWEEWLADMPYTLSCPQLDEAPPGSATAPKDRSNNKLSPKAAALVLYVDEASSHGSPGTSLLDEAVQLARDGKIAESIKALAVIEDKQLEAIGSAEAWNTLCWHGTLGGHAKEVLSACEKAVTQAARPGSRISPEVARDSRGVARAVLGDTTGAIADFTAFLTWCAQSKCGAAGARREAWVRELRRGRNPFDAKTLSSLRDE